MTSLLPETIEYRFIDPCEIQGFPPPAVDEALAEAGVDYPALLESIAGLLLARSPRFGQDLAPFLLSYFHEHNFETPLSPVDHARLKGMIDAPETVDVDSFRRLTPIVVLKATTLAVETFIQNRPAWVLKAIPQLGTIQESLTALSPG